MVYSRPVILESVFDGLGHGLELKGLGLNSDLLRRSRTWTLLGFVSWPLGL